MSRELSNEECDQVAKLFQLLLATSNQKRGDVLADKIDDIIEQANEASFADIAKLIHQKNLPMMMKLPRVTRYFRCYVVDRAQIGTYPPRPLGPPKKQPGRQHDKIKV